MARATDVGAFDCDSFIGGSFQEWDERAGARGSACTTPGPERRCALGEQARICANSGALLAPRPTCGAQPASPAVASTTMECRQKQRCLHQMPIRGRPVSIARLPLILMLFVSASAPGLGSCADAAVVNVDVERRGEGVIIEASTRLNSDATTAWRVLTDYERYGDFIPGVISSRVVDRRGSTVVVEQSDELALWLLRMPLHVTYAIRESPPNLVQSRATSDSLPALESSYLLTPLGSGIRLEYIGHLDRAWPFLGRLEQGVLRQRVVHQFTALANEIERRSADVHRAD